ncbi:EpsG family protein [Leclercia sp. J807]|uniref:EpsG family protein n=1 Tax=Leclercia sp. J807 TaxID=2681307 RepID=UPI0012E0E2AA|nr:EpsG family protein [Leclercia sp. J807]QGU11516.1 EpsG family protein [Leclercia sp. J807]
MLYLIFFTLTAFVLLFLTNKRQAGVIILILSIAYLTFAFPGGNDWLGYFSFYDCIWNDVCQLNPTYFEPGYVALVFIFGYFGYYFLTVAIALIVLIRLYYFCKHFDRPALVYFFFLAMFLWVLYFEAVRQALALTFLLSALIAGYKKQKVNFFLFVIAAAMFHATALIFMIMMLPLISLKLTKTLGKGVLLVSLCFMLIPEQFILFVLSFLPASSPIAAKMYFYLNTEQYKPQLSVGIGTIFDLLLIFILFNSRKILKRLNIRTGYEYKTAFSITILGVILFVSFAILIGKVMPVMTRIGWYFLPYVIISIYIHIGRSFVFPYLKDINPKHSLYKFLIIVFMMIQVIRPFMYDISRYNLLNQKTIFQEFDNLPDSQLREEAASKCDTLYKLNAGFLCSL